VLAQTRFDAWARSTLPARRDEIVDELVSEHARVSGDAFKIDSSHWGIHGLIPVDGDVILAKFDSRSEAQDAIQQLWELERR